MKQNELADVTDDLADADLGHVRRTKRLVKIVKSVQKAPWLPIPRVCESAADCEAAYRFLESDDVATEAIIAPHRKKTAERAARLDVVIVAHDTTTVCVGGGARPGLGVVDPTDGVGFYLHNSCCFALDGEPLGVQRMYAWIRTEAVAGKRSQSESQYDPDSEAERWHDAVHEVDDAIRQVGDFGRLAPSPLIIHVMDREADSLRLLCDMQEHGRCFVVRASHNRRLEPGRHKAKTMLFEAVSSTDVRCTHSMQVVRRMSKVQKGSSTTVSGAKGVRPRKFVHKWTETRNANFEVRAMTTRIYPGNGQHAQVPKDGLVINIVHAQEVNAPEGVEPVCWYLLTDQSIDTPEDLCFVIHSYGLRWLIEEYHNAVKTGCQLEMHRFRHGNQFIRMLCIVVPIAVQMLRLRWFDRERPEADATQVLEQEHIDVLQAHQEKQGKKLPVQPTVRQVMLVIARLGGHLKHNGPPGWQVLYRGLAALEMLVEGYRLCRDMALAQQQAGVATAGKRTTNPRSQHG